MATEKLNINGWDNGWPTGFVTNVDEPIASADGSSVSTTIDGDSVKFDFEDSALTDFDTVTGITVTARIRADWTGDKPEFPGFPADPPIVGATLYIGGVAQFDFPLPSPVNTTAFWKDHVFTNTGWDQDWTQAQLSTLQVGLYVTNVEAETFEVFLDCIDVDITYDAPLAKEPDEATLALTGHAPADVDVSDTHVWKSPDEVALALSGHAPTLDLSIATPVNAARLNGKQSYVNTLTMQLQPNVWDNGWPTGFVANVDEPTASADGDTVSTTISGDAAIFGLDDVTGTIVDLDEVLSVSIVLRAAGSAVLEVEGGDEIPGNANVLVELLIDGVSQGFVPKTLSSNQQNYTVTKTDWNQDWSVSQLNNMQVRVSTLFAGEGEVLVDAIDVIVEYANQSPLTASPGVAARSLAGTAPSLKYDRFISPAAEALTLNEQTLSLLRTYNERPFEVQRHLNPKLPYRIVNFIRQPSVGGVVIDGKAETIVMDHFVSPAANTLALSGQVPVSVAVADHVASPARRALMLEPESVLVPVTNSSAFIVPRLKQYLTGKVPTASTTRHVWENPTAASAALSGQAPSLAGSVGRTPAIDALSLSGQAPLVLRGTVITASKGGLALSGGQPQLGLLPDTLTLAGQAPTLDYTVALALGALTLTGKAPPAVLVSATMPETSTLTLSGQAPTLGFSTQLTPGLPGLISLSIDYGIELIGTPTDIVVD